MSSEAIKYIIYSNIYKYEHLFLELLDSFMKLLLASVMTFQVFTIILTLKAIGLSSKHEEKRFMNFININFALLFINYLGFSHIDKILSMTEYFHTKTTAFGYMIVIFIISFLIYSIVFSIGYFALLTIGEIIKELEKHNKNKEK